MEHHLGAPFGEGAFQAHAIAYVAHHGTFTASATQATGGSRDAVALFYTHRFRQSCSVIAVGGGTQVAASTAEGGVFVRTDAKDLVGAFVSGKEHHRYRFAFRVVTGAGEPTSTGVGLSNIRDRLGQAYGDEHRFEIRTPPEGGFTVIIEIPYEPAKAVEPEQIRLQGYAPATAPIPEKRPLGTNV